MLSHEGMGVGQSGLAWFSFIKTMGSRHRHRESEAQAGLERSGNRSKEREGVIAPGTISKSLGRKQKKLLHSECVCVSGSVCLC